jgi:CheY-like chemotaxis protein
MPAPGKTLLMVEDGPDERMLFDRAVQRTAVSFSVHFAADGQEAIDYLRGDGGYADRHRFPLPDLLMLDLHMPRLSGFDVLAWIRKQPEMHELPVIMYSASSHPVDVSRAYRLSANSYLVKPTTVADLTTTVRMIESYWMNLNLSPRTGPTGWSSGATASPAMHGDAHAGDGI